VYLIEEDPITLIDTGPKTKEAYEALRDGLRQSGLRVSDIKRILLTHTHEDHFGLARKLLDEAGAASVYIHPWESGHLARDGYEPYVELLVRAGLPNDVIEEMRGVYNSFHGFADSLEDMDVLSMEDEMELEFATGSLRVLHTPGHTPGSCVFFRESDRTIFSGDCILKRITPNPILAPDPIDPARRFPSLAEFQVSLARIREIAPTLIFGGHGDPVNDYEELFNRYVRQIRERQNKTYESLGGDGMTAWQLSLNLFPDAGNVHRFLAVSEAVAHLELAHSEGKVAVEISGKQEIYRRI
ncbi:MAG: MBL fold metallo-hydrolase, partial [Pyrinomonadaceae bacterium]